MDYETDGKFFQKNISKKLLQVKTLLSILFMLTLIRQGFGQLMTLADYLSKSSAIAAFESAAEVGRNLDLEGTAFNPEQPTFQIQTPTDDGIGIQVQQNFDFPTVYTRRSKWLKSQTSLSKENYKVVLAGVYRDASIQYLSLQILQEKIRLLTRQDSLLKSLAAASQRFFDNGEINKADLLFAQRNAYLTQLNLQQLKMDQANTLADMQFLAGQTFTEVEPLQRLQMPVIAVESKFIFEDYNTTQSTVIENEKKVVRAQRLPGLMIGYTRETEVETQFNHRLGAGITIPIWQGQYTARLKSLDTESNLNEWKTTTLRKQAEYKAAMLKEIINASDATLSLLENEIETLYSDEVTTSSRLFEAGELDYTIMLRNIADAISVRNQYLETLERHNKAVIELKALYESQWKAYPPKE